MPITGVRTASGTCVIALLDQFRRLAFGRRPFDRRGMSRSFPAAEPRISRPCMRKPTKKRSARRAPKKTARKKKQFRSSTSSSLATDRSTKKKRIAKKPARPKTTSPPPRSGPEETDNTRELLLGRAANYTLDYIDDRWKVVNADDDYSERSKTEHYWAAHAAAVWANRGRAKLGIGREHRERVFDRLKKEHARHSAKVKR